MVQFNGAGVRIYAIKGFSRFQRRERLADAALAEAIERMELGLLDADLGGGLAKQRVARAGQGKSGGYRTILAYRRGDRAIFLFGFAKSERASLDEDELVSWRRIGRLYLGLAQAGIDAAVAIGELRELSHDND